MHALDILSGILQKSCTHIHATRLASLLAAVEAAIHGNRLTLSDLGRGLTSRVSIKHKIKRVDRLLGNTALHSEIPSLYEALARPLLAGLKMPRIVVDWSDITPDRQWQWLRAALVSEGRSITLYEQVHPITQAQSMHAHKMLLAHLARMLPEGSTPILITDAGFRGTWFALVESLCWHWVGRIRNRDMLRKTGENAWQGCKTLYARATAQAQDLGAYEYVRSRPVTVRLICVKRIPKGRHKKSRQGQRVRSSHSQKHARGQQEPWLLAANPGLADVDANTIVAIYASRMQIEEAFRDVKSERFGLGFAAGRSAQQARWAVLLLIANLAMFVLRCVGTACKNIKAESRFQSNTRRTRAVLSVISLGLQSIRCHAVSFTRREMRAAFDQVLYQGIL